VYKAVNSLLHDLHTEQQHRRLMFPPYSSSSSLGSSSSPNSHSSTSQEPPAGKSNFPTYLRPSQNQGATPTERYRQGAHASETMSKSRRNDAVNVHDYEAMNR
jgi:hypothetical protein